MITTLLGFIAGYCLVDAIRCRYALWRAVESLESAEAVLGTGDERVRREAAAALRMEALEKAHKWSWTAEQVARALDAAARLEKGSHEA